MLMYNFALGNSSSRVQSTFLKEQSVRNESSCTASILDCEMLDPANSPGVKLYTEGN